MFDVDPIGPLSPSPSLLVERIDHKPTTWQDYFLEDQLLQFFLKPSVIHYSLKDTESAALTVGTGEVLLCARRERHNVRWDEDTSVLSVRLPDAALMEAARHRPHKPPEIRAMSPIADQRLSHLLFALNAERTCGYAAGRLFLDSMEMALAGTLLSSLRALPPETVSHCGGMAPHTLRRVLDFMHSNVEKDVRLGQLAECAGLGLSHFSSQFRLSTSQSPWQFMLRLRVDRSKVLLRDKRLSILAVALATGFRNQQHFATVFKKRTGIPPSTYRATQ